jgi:hypothetical protein
MYVQSNSLLGREMFLQKKYKNLRNFHMPTAILLGGNTILHVTRQSITEMGQDSQQSKPSQ